MGSPFFPVPMLWQRRAVPTIPAVPDEFVTLGELFTHAGFMTGLATGLLVLGLFYAASLVMKRWMGGWGMAFVGIVLVVLSFRFEVEPSLFLGFALLALGGWLLDVADSVGDRIGAKAVKIFAWALLAGAALWLTTAVGFPDEVWVLVAFPFVVLAAGTAVRMLNRPPMSELLGAMFAVSIFGLWVTVPETDMIRVLLGVSIPLALATLPLISARVTGAGAFALVGLFAWLTVDGGSTSPVSIIGGWATMGMLPLIPLVGLHRRLPGKIPILGLHVIAVALASRVVGSWESVVAASVGVVVLAVSFVMILGIVPAGPEVTKSALSESEVKRS